MTLRDFLNREGLTFTAFAQRIGSDHASTVARYAKGAQIPDRVMMLRIVEATAGQVTANDFYGIDAAEASSVPDQHAAVDNSAGRAHAPGNCEILSAERVA